MEDSPTSIVAQKTEGPLYRLAYDLYAKQNYREACHLFRNLVVAHPQNFNYWKGFGACLQMEKQYEIAINCYFCCQILMNHEEDLFLHVHLADCYFALGKVKQGLFLLEQISQEASKRGESSLNTHAELMKTLWST